jgi:hypothetical protein
MTRLTELYRRILECDQPIPAAMQQRMLGDLTKKNHELLAMLASRPELTEEVDRVIAEMTEPEIVAGWAARPGRGNEEIAARFRDEHRIANILPLARLRGLPAEVYMHLGRPESVKVAEALYSNPSVPAACKLLRIEVGIDLLESKKGWKKQAHTRDAIDGDHDLAIAVLRRARSVGVIMGALESCGGLDTETLDDLLNRLPLMIEDDREQVTALSEVLEALALLDLDDKQLGLLRKAVKKATSVHGNVKASYWSQSFDGAKFLTSPKGRDTLATIRDLEHTVEIAQAAKTLKTLASRNRGYTSVAELAVNAACRNPYLPAAVLRPYIDNADTTNLLTAIQRWMADGEYDHLVEMANEEYGAPWWLMEIENPLPLLLRAVEIAKETGTRIRGWVTEHPMVVGSPQLALDTLPWHYIADIDEVAEYSPETDVNPDLIVGAAARLITERLGTDPDKWEIFSRLAEEYDGTLPELLETASTL